MGQFIISRKKIINRYIKGNFVYDMICFAGLILANAYHDDKAS
jgi:hypothetical protein